jgi:hypothetical protein
MNAITTADFIMHKGEPRLLDLRVAEALAYSQPRDIRKLIQRKMDELQRYGEVCATMAQTEGDEGENRATVARLHPKRGPMGAQFMLNEGQALLLCALSDTPKAPDARQMLIMGYMEWRRGQKTQPSLDAPTDFMGQPFEITSDAAKIWDIKLATVREARHLWGHERARAVWRQLGLAVPPDTPVGGQDEARDCLASLLGGEVHGSPLRHLLMQAMDGDEATAQMLHVHGIWVEDDEDGFSIANRNTSLERIMQGTRYAGAKWSYTLRRFNGATASKTRRYEPELTSRGTFLPSRVLDLFAEG